MHLGRTQAAWTVLGLVVGLAGCTTPAKPREAARPSQTLQGEYVATFHTPYTGPIRCAMTVETGEHGIKGNTRPGVAWAMFEGVERLLGPLVAPFVFPSGMILTWKSDVGGGDKPAEGTLGVGSLSTLRVRTRLRSVDEPVELVYKDGRVVGVMTLEARAAGGGAVADYPALAAAAGEALHANLFDPELAASEQSTEYVKDLKAAAAKAQDDVEFLFGSFLAARRHVKFGTPLIYRVEGEAESARLLAGRQEAPKAYTVTRDEATGVVTLRLDVMAEPAEVDAAFVEALGSKPAGLIVDLRTCVGPTLASLRAAQWVVRRPTEMGAFFGPGTRGEGKNPDAAPTQRRLVRDGAEAAAGELALDAASFTAFAVEPEARAFAGPVLVLTSKRTSSTAEAMVAALQAAGRIEVVGEKTAGRPMLSRAYDVGQGWVLRVPAEDYRLASGAMVPKAGISPDHDCGKDSAPEHAKKRMAELLAPGARAGL